MTPDAWPLRNSLILGALPTAVPCARLHAKHVVWEWGLDHLSETVELLVSELVTNAVQATARTDDVMPIRLRLFSDKARVLIEVRDGDSRPPVPKKPAEDGIAALEEEDGRGLLLVATLSTQWDWYRLPHWGGKVVWCEVGELQPDNANATP